MTASKNALLIGVSRYGKDIPTLSAPPNDVAALLLVLDNSNLGGFDNVRPLINPGPVSMRRAIQDLFKNAGKDDLILLYFSGHGIIDDDDHLYLSSCLTSSDHFEATSVEASFIQKLSRNCHAKRQVIILDCCYSGAFSNGWQTKSVGINLRKELGAEGRVVLTSSTATQTSYQHCDEINSLYTKYLVEGIETGEADADKDGKIFAHELHYYAKERVQASKPKMKPDIILDNEGYDILISHSSHVQETEQQTPAHSLDTQSTIPSSDHLGRLTENAQSNWFSPSTNIIFSIANLLASLVLLCAVMFGGHFSRLSSQPQNITSPTLPISPPLAQVNAKSILSSNEVSNGKSTLNNIDSYTTGHNTEKDAFHYLNHYSVFFLTAVVAYVFSCFTVFEKYGRDALVAVLMANGWLVSPWWVLSGAAVLLGSISRYFFSLLSIDLPGITTFFTIVACIPPLVGALLTTSFVLGDKDMAAIRVNGKNPPIYVLAVLCGYFLVMAITFMISKSFAVIPIGISAGLLAILYSSQSGVSANP